MAACVPLKGSKACSAWQSSSVSTTDDHVVGLFPFLKYVSSVGDFDSLLTTYVQTDHVREQYGTLLGCSRIDYSNTSDLYARFTTTAQFAQSEAYVLADKSLCPNPSSEAQAQIRADFTNCALPADSLSSQDCIPAITNEPDNCGYGNSTIGLCSYCAKGGINSTDTCCYSSDAETRCAGVVLPTISPISLPTVTATVTPNHDSTGGGGLSGGKIAGIVIGSVLGAGIIAALAFMLLLYRRRRNGSQNGSIFNQPSPARRGPPAPQMAQTGAPAGFEVLPGGRVARMSALEGHSADAPSRHTARDTAGSVPGTSAGYRGSRRRGDDHSSSDGFGDSPASDRGAAGVLRPPPTMRKRNGSLSSNSVLAGEDAHSPSSGGMSSPQGMASQQSEQLPFFKDYYSQDDIHPGDRVAVLWAYQPRAADEFLLERGDMLKVVGIWDDGWATGVMVDERAEQWEARRQAQRDSGVSNTSGRAHDESPPVSGEIKAFPLVCVCLPEHWKKTIEGDGSTDAASSALPYTTTTQT
ncbi:eefa9606-5d67-4d23-a96d-fe40a87be0b0 [Thermothielavioides terrestris]|uniref:Eefa9606-5d67-4d23-a96d-fe40a87be0b0 n=1 Tax=Thermothielavioides terrestris TaxID=2587410 RepID=A0A3S4AQ25_9PEZI|nr:eefa9606-5d67-4d23-a96d-fe40a87be0b0 [Thermothielavioides terrestris]